LRGSDGYVLQYVNSRCAVVVQAGAAAVTPAASEPPPPGPGSAAPERVTATSDVAEVLEAMRKGGDRMWVVSWDGAAYTVRVVGQIRRRVTVDPP